MDTSVFFVLAWVLSLSFTVLVGAGIITYLRRTWQLIRADGDGSAQSKLLDATEQIQLQLYSMSERLERLEEGLSSGRSGDQALPPTHDG